MSGHYPEYPGDDPGPVTPPVTPPATPPEQPAGNPAGQGPGSQGPGGQLSWGQHSWGQGEPAVPPSQPPTAHQPNFPPPHGGGWPPPEPPRPAEPVVAPTSMRVAFWLMILGAIATVAQALLLFTDLGTIREVIAADVDGSDPAFNDPGFETFLDIIVIVVVVGASLYTLVVAALWTWMAVTTVRGRRWARITATVLGSVNLAMSLLDLVFVSLSSPTSGAFGPTPGSTTGTTWLDIGSTFVYMVITAVTMALLWLPASTAFFRDATLQAQWERWAESVGRRSPG